MFWHANKTGVCFDFMTRFKCKFLFLCYFLKTQPYNSSLSSLKSWECFVFCTNHFGVLQYTHALKLLFWFTHSLLKYVLKLSRKALSCSKLRKKEIRERVLLWHALMKSIMSSLFWFKFSKISFQKIVKVSVELLGYIYLQCSPCLLFAQ